MRAMASTISSSPPTTCILAHGHALALRAAIRASQGRELRFTASARRSTGAQARATHYSCRAAAGERGLQIASTAISVSVSLLYIAPTPLPVASPQRRVAAETSRAASCVCPVGATHCACRAAAGERGLQVPVSSSIAVSLVSTVSRIWSQLLTQTRAARVPTCRGRLLVRADALVPPAHLQRACLRPAIYRQTPLADRHAQDTAAHDLVPLLLV